MKDFIIKLNDKFSVPPNISRITAEEWEIILNYASDLLLKHDSISSKIASSDIEQMLESKYSAQITSKDDQIAMQLQEITIIKDKYEKQIKRQKKELETNFKVSNNEAIEAIKLSLQGAVQSKDIIIQDLQDRLAELRNHLTQTNTENIAPLREQITAREQEIINLKDHYKKQLKTQRKEIEEEYRLNSANSIQANKLSLQEEIESKDSVIKALKKQLNDLQTNITQFDSERLIPLQKQIDIYRKQLHEQQMQYVNNLSEEKAKVVSLIESKYEEQLQLTRQQATSEVHELISKYNSEIKTLYEKHNKELNKTREQADQRTAEQIAALTEQYNSKNNLQDDLFKRLEPIVKFYGGTNSEKGDGGEVSIKNILTTINTYDDAIVEDVSGQTASGDILFTWKKMKCLIEVKNKSKLVRDDIDKFIRDVNQSVDKINCAIFVSLQSNQFPGRSREIMQLDYINGVPVIYTYMPPPSKEIHFAIACLERVIQTYEVTTGYQEELQRHFINYYANVLEYQKFFDQELRKSQREVKALTKHYDHFNSLCEQLSPMYAKLSKTSQEETQEDTVEPSDSVEPLTEPSDEIESSNEPTKILLESTDEQLIQLANEYIKLSLKNQNPTIKLLSTTFNVSDKIIEYIGFKNIAIHAKQLYLQKVITKDKSKKILEFYATNERYPNQKELITNKIFNDYNVRLLSKVIKSKNFSDVIGEYCTSLITPVESAPVESTPIKSAPVESAPVESAPIKKKKVILRKVIRKPAVSNSVDEPVDT